VRVTLLGTGDTTGTPTVACDCDTCARAHELGVERTRFSVHVENERTGESLLIDFSPDFRAQFLANNVALPDAAVVTHIHFDHLDGLGNVFRLLRDLEVHAASEVDPVTGESVAGTVRRRYDYLDQVRVGGQQPGDTFTAAGFDVTLYPVTPSAARLLRRHRRDRGCDARTHRRHELRRARGDTRRALGRRPPSRGRHRARLDL